MKSKMSLIIKVIAIVIFCCNCFFAYSDEVIPLPNENMIENYEVDLINEVDEDLSNEASKKSFFEFCRNNSKMVFAFVLGLYVLYVIIKRNMKNFGLKNNINEFIEERKTLKENETIFFHVINGVAGVLDLAYLINMWVVAFICFSAMWFLSISYSIILSDETIWILIISTIVVYIFVAKKGLQFVIKDNCFILRTYFFNAQKIMFDEVKDFYRIDRRYIVIEGQGKEITLVENMFDDVLFEKIKEKVGAKISS